MESDVQKDDEVKLAVMHKGYIRRKFIFIIVGVSAVVLVSLTLCVLYCTHWRKYYGQYSQGKVVRTDEDEEDDGENTERMEEDTECDHDDVILECEQQLVEEAVIKDDVSESEDVVEQYIVSDLN